MKACTLGELIEQNFSVIFVNALRQEWQSTRSFQCFDEPKKHNLLLFLDGGYITYTAKDGRTLTAHSGDVVYTPIGSEYRANLYEFDTSAAHTIGVNFHLLDAAGEGVILSEDIQVFHVAQPQAVPVLFQRLLHEGTPNDFTRKRILLMEILCALTAPETDRAQPHYIAEAQAYLSEHLENCPSVCELAAHVHVSEVYFRRQFKRYTGKTPLGYRNELRLGRARAYLEYGDISVQEISDSLGYATVSHFIKEFRHRYGCSPLKYRKAVRDS